PNEPAPPAAPAGPVLRAVEWRGTDALDPSQLQERIFTRSRPWWAVWKPRPPFDEATLEADMLRITDAYRENGRYRATASYALQWNETHDEVTVVITVDEGPAVTLENWTIDLGELPAEPGPWPRPLLADLPLKKGEVFTIALYGTAKRKLLQRMWDQGFPDATLSGGGDVDLATETAEIHWVAHPGPRVRIGEVRIEGAQTVKES